jgi:hypothetical protein
VKVSACLVTRGDQEEELQRIIESIPQGWEIVIWDNGEKMVSRSDGYAEVCTDLAVYGRYAAIAHASHDLIFVQDDDVIVSDPQAIVDEWDRVALTKESDPAGPQPDWNSHVVCNMPQEFRPHYPDSGLVGFGAAFHWDAPQRAWLRLGQWRLRELEAGRLAPRVAAEVVRDSEVFLRRCDNVFTTLTPIVMVDVPKIDCAYASDSNRMWRQSDHIGERDRMIQLARQVRDV